MVVFEKLNRLALLALVVSAVALVACGGNDGATAEVPQAPAGGEVPSPELPEAPAIDTAGNGAAEIDTAGSDAALTTQEYAAALESAFAYTDEAGDDEIEAAFESFFADAQFPENAAERISALEGNESWSEEDVIFATSYAESMLRQTAILYEVILTVFEHPLAEISSLEPPEHLSQLHEDFVSDLTELNAFLREQVEAVTAVSTNIGSRANLADFTAALNSLESGPSDPDLQQQGQALAEQVESVCLELKDQLEAELEREVDLCE